MFPMMFPCVPTPDKCSKNFSHDICFAKQEVGKGTRSKEWRLCAGLGLSKEKAKGHVGREREREREVCNAFTPKTNKSWDDDHADDKKLLRTSSTRSMSLPAGNCGGGGMMSFWIMRTSTDRCWHPCGNAMQAPTLCDRESLQI